MSETRRYRRIRRAEFDYWLAGILADAKRAGAIEALEKAATDLEQQGVEPWDSNSVAIRTLRLQIARLREEQS